MEYSDNGLKFTTQFEGLRLQSYQDSVGVWTIGWCHTRDVAPSQSITQDQAMEFLKEDIQPCVDFINSQCKVQLNQNQFDALVDFAFNLGTGALGGSTLFKLVNAGDFAAAAEEFIKWNHAGGKVLPGLTKRRLAERDLFLSTMLQHSSNKNYSGW